MRNDHFQYGHRLIGGAAALVFTTALSVTEARALSIVPTFDSSITSLSNASTVESAFRTAAAVYTAAFSNPVTIDINVSWGSVAGTALPSNAVGASSASLYGYFSYSTIKNWLSSGDKTSVGYNAVTNLPSSTPESTASFVLPSAEAKALGLISPTGGVDGSIGFAGSSVTGYSFGTGSTAPNTYNFVSVAEHEIAEVLGRTSYVGSGYSALTPFDLFRFTSKGVNSTSSTALTYFSTDGGQTVAAYFNNSSSGGDRSDWQTSGSGSDASDAFISPGQTKTVSPIDITGLQTLGYNTPTYVAASPTPTRTIDGRGAGDLAITEPSALALLGLGLLTAGLVRRR